MYSWLMTLFVPKATIKDYKAAGCLFTNGTHVLAGLQKKHGVQWISGFGGSKHDGETHTRTALRELIEELLEVTVSDGVLVAIELRVKPVKTKLRGSYVLLHYTFDDLEEILRLAEPFCRDTPLYVFFPCSVMDLINNRTKTQGEVSTLCLLPLEPDLRISPEFLGDLEGI